MTKHVLTVTMPVDCYAKFNALQQLSEASAELLLERALSVYDFLYREQAAGARIVVQRPDGTEQGWRLP